MTSCGYVAARDFETVCAHDASRQEWREEMSSGDEFEEDERLCCSIMMQDDLRVRAQGTGCCMHTLIT